MSISLRGKCRPDTGHIILRQTKNFGFRIALEVVLIILAFCAVINAQTTPPLGKHDSDRAAILADITAITQAYLDGDVEKIYLTHSADWTGFLGRSAVPIKGLDAYMKFQGLVYPVPVGAPKPTPDKTTTFRITDFDLNFVTENVGVANFAIEYGTKSGPDFVPSNRIRITDIYAKRKGNWMQVASHVSRDPRAGDR